MQGALLVASILWTRKHPTMKSVQLHVPFELIDKTKIEIKKNNVYSWLIKKDDSCRNYQD